MIKMQKRDYNYYIVHYTAYSDTDISQINNLPNVTKGCFIHNRLIFH